MAELHGIDSALERLIVDDRGSPVSLPNSGIGAPVRRQDGTAKVTGTAIFAGEAAPAGTLHAAFVSSPLAKGRIVSLDTARAATAKGVTHVITPGDMPQLGSIAVPPTAQSFVPMSDDSVRYEGQPVAMVLAETLEQAEHAASLVIVQIEPQTPKVFATAEVSMPRAEGNGYAFAALDGGHGEAEAVFGQAAIAVDETYVAPTRHHNMMEPSVTWAEWRGDELHMHDATQWTFGIRYALSGILQMDPSRIHVRCPFTGGGFGAKGYVWPHQILAPIAARIAGRPVKLSIGRYGCYTDSGYQPVVESRLRLGAGEDGKLISIIHDSENVSSTFDDYIEFGSAGTRSLYAAQTSAFSTRIRKADVSTPTAMRAPHEGPGMYATESAMDELAYKLGMDPLELRLRNYAETDPYSGKPFSSNKLREAYAEGARRIGWSARPMEPRARRDGNKMIGLGMASAIMSTFRFASAARIALAADGKVTVEAGSQEIGTGTRTILAQVAAERLGIPADRVKVELGSTGLPETGGTFGSSSTISVGSAVASAADELLARLRELAGSDSPPPPDDWPSLLTAKGVGRLQAMGGFELPGGAMFDAHGGEGEYSMHTWGAVFVEMEVDEDLGLARMRRAVGCYSAGRILNPATARSQMIGGIIWGYGRAILEVSAMDQRYGRYLSKNLSGVMLPVNADIPRDIDVCFIEENDPHASAIGVRGIGELGEVGVAAAITNAIYHATGKRIRELPVHIMDIVAV
ncbi:MAG: xanthine dehydrogenase family protein molybdopterin-binding subunit [Pseudomonadota bacterium]